VSAVVGIELGTHAVRAVVHAARGRVTAVHTSAWSPTRPEEAVATLRAACGPVSRIVLAVGLARLHVKAVALPPIDGASRRQVLRTEPERFFTVAPATPLAVTVLDAAGLALAADADEVASWVAAFETWAPVARVEGAPVALARTVAASGVRDGTVTLEAGDGERGTITLREATLAGVRRTIAMAETTTDEAPSFAVADVPLSHHVAHGAALGARDADVSTRLLAAADEARLVRDVRRTRLVWGLAAATWCAATVYAAGWSRDQALLAVENELAAQRPALAVAQAVADTVRRLDLEVDAIEAQGAAARDPLDVLGLVGERLPEDAVAQRLRMSGDAWTVDGNAAAATAVLAALAAEPRFTDVRFLAPSTRFRDGNEDRESFSIAFVVR
jgi:hypothetical protein